MGEIEQIAIHVPMEVALHPPSEIRAQKGWCIVGPPPKREIIATIYGGGVRALTEARLFAAAPDLLAACQAFVDAAPSDGARCLYCNVDVYSRDSVQEHNPDCELEQGRRVLARLQSPDGERGDSK